MYEIDIDTKFSLEVHSGIQVKDHYESIYINSPN